MAVPRPHRRQQGAGQRLELDDEIRGQRVEDDHIEIERARNRAGAVRRELRLDDENADDCPFMRVASAARWRAPGSVPPLSTAACSSP